MIQNGGEQTQNPNAFKQGAIRVAAFVQQVGSLDDRRGLAGRAQQ